MVSPPAWALAEHVCMRRPCVYCQLMDGTLPTVPAPAKLILLKTAEATAASTFQKHLLEMDDASVTHLVEVFEGMLVAYRKGRG